MTTINRCLTMEYKDARKAAEAASVGRGGSNLTITDRQETHVTQASLPWANALHIGSEHTFETTRASPPAKRR